MDASGPNALTASSVDSSSEDIMKILIATDIHLGHLENHAVRGDDSFIAFEEVLATAAEAEVDFILLGGDLFDHARPSPACMLRATRALRRHCLGDRPVALELLSDQSSNFGRTVNYQDPNLNVSFPVLSIHGNHDDPVGHGAVSSLDILSSMGLVNYFGRWTDYTHVALSPVLLAKGATKLALYGLGHVKDQRLSRLFKDQQVEMQRPPGDDWFNMLVLHQNRADRGVGNYIKEEVLPEFLDFIVWGHEHDCRVHEEQNENKRFFVSQPGSTVATSLAAGEAIPKHVALLQIHMKKFVLTPIPLKTVRPFIFKTVVLSEENLEESSVNENEKVQEFLKSKVYEAIEEAKMLHSGHPKQPTLPLIRLSVFYERESQDFNRVRFGQNFSGVVANPEELLVMKREKRVRTRQIKDEDGDEADLARLAGSAAEAPDVEALLHTYFGALPPTRQPGLLAPRALATAVRAFTARRDDDAFRSVLRATRRRALDALLASSAASEEDVAELLRGCRLELDGAEPQQLQELLVAAPPQLPTALELSSEEEAERVTAVRGRGRGRGRARGRGRGVARAVSPPETPERRSTPRRTAAKRSASWLQNIITNKTNDIDDDSD